MNIVKLSPLDINLVEFWVGNDPLNPTNKFSMELHSPNTVL